MATEVDVFTLINAKLPMYVGNYMLASGFNLPDVIASIDTSNKHN